MSTGITDETGISLRLPFACFGDFERSGDVTTIDRKRRAMYKMLKYESRRQNHRVCGLLHPFHKDSRSTRDSCSRDNLSFSRSFNAQMAKGRHACQRWNPSTTTDPLHGAAGCHGGLHVETPNYRVA